MSTLANTLESTLELSIDEMNELRERLVTLQDQLEQCLSQHCFYRDSIRSCIMLGSNKASPLSSFHPSKSLPLNKERNIEEGEEQWHTGLWLAGESAQQSTLNLMTELAEIKCWLANAGH